VHLAEEVVLMLQEVVPPLVRLVEQVQEIQVQMEQMLLQRLFVVVVVAEEDLSPGLV
jgi:hypothetical protein